ncbi:PAS domain-containing sensor histidine kinase [Dactylosporangium vinaceum]|uniref:histidine kinase n=1 Tax=Dactylosporangium vinaceum TaxID=53362 RepID=A0ABV5M230_9ACTN|nr:ATP-binding protein [Dactylosporangium vinaceum]UAB99393.1 PAS domain-containing sensor histidine kinase [Dactylosporangium vinaceum]
MRSAGVRGTVVAAAGLAAATLVLEPLRTHVSLASVTLLYLIPVAATAAAGGLWTALGAAVAADLVVNFFFVPPLHTLGVASVDNVVVLIVYMLVAAAVAVAIKTAGRARELAEVDRLRTALLDAVSHDLRTPLAGIKAAAATLRDPELELAPADEAALLETVEDSTDRMTALVENLLSLSRLRAGALAVHAEPTALDAAVAAVVIHLAVDNRVPDDLPLARADPGLLQRVITNLVANALAAAPHVRITGAAAGDRVELRVIDDGPGVPAKARALMFEPFQRLGDSGGTGLGLGLAIVRGFTEAMGGTVEASETPGGGLTVTVGLPRA